jgi:hypothetical protein
MTIAELTTYRVLEDLASPVLVEGYVVGFATFYEWGVSVPSHRFLCTLPQYYDLELHNLTPPGVLHITTFVTLCEAFMGIDPFRPMEPLLHVQCSQGSGAEMTVSGGAIIHVKSGHGVDPYFNIPMPRSMNGCVRSSNYYGRRG